MWRLWFNIIFSANLVIDQLKGINRSLLFKELIKGWMFVVCYPFNSSNCPRFACCRSPCWTSNWQTTRTDDRSGATRSSARRTPPSIAAAATRSPSASRSSGGTGWSPPPTWRLTTAQASAAWRCRTRLHTRGSHRKRRKVDRVAHLPRCRRCPFCTLTRAATSSSSCCRTWKWRDVVAPSTAGETTRSCPPVSPAVMAPDLRNGKQNAGRDF